MSRRGLLLGLGGAAVGAGLGGTAVAATRPSGQPQGWQPGPFPNPGQATTIGAVPSGDDTVVTRPGTSGIQEAVDAAPSGGVVRLAPGSVHDIDSVSLPDKDVVLAMQGARINVMRPGAFGFVQRNRRRLTVIGGTFAGRGSGIRFELPADNRQSYDFSASGVTFDLPPDQTAVRLTGAREATLTECYFLHCVGIALDESVNTHVMGCQFQDCVAGVVADGSATGSGYNAGLMIYNSTMLGCGHGVHVIGWDWATIVNSMIDYCDRPVVLTNVDGASIATSYLSNRDVGPTAFPVLDVLTDERRPGGACQHVTVSNSQVISHAESARDQSVGIRLHAARWFSLSNSSVHFWHRFGVHVTAASSGVRIDGNVFNPDPAALPDAASVFGAGTDDSSWIITRNIFGAPVRNVAESVMRDNV